MQNFRENKTTAVEIILLLIEHSNVITPYNLSLSIWSFQWVAQSSAFRRRSCYVQQCIVDSTDDNNWYMTLLYYFWSSSKTRTYCAVCDRGAGEAQALVFIHLFLLFFYLVISRLVRLAYRPKMHVRSSKHRYGLTKFDVRYSSEIHFAPSTTCSPPRVY